MPRDTFKVETGRSTFRLSRATRERIRALMLDLDQDATAVIEIAVAQLFDREIGPASERDVFAELDALKARIDELAAR